MSENIIIVITMILNLIIAFTKLIVGIVFSFSTLIADSIQSFMDFITDITSLIANKVGKRRANKTYPFGYGQVYYVSNLLTGVLLFLIGIFILYQFFFFKGELIPNIYLLITIIIVLVMKLTVVKLLSHYGKEYKSELMIEASKESKADFISTCVVLGVFILSVIKKYITINIDIDKIGCLGMAVYVFYTSLKMIISNMRGILVNDEENDEVKKLITEELNNFKDIDIKGVKVIKMSIYYSVFLKVKVTKNITIKKYLAIEKDMKKHLKSKNKLIRYIDIELV